MIGLEKGRLTRVARKDTLRIMSVVAFLLKRDQPSAVQLCRNLLEILDKMGISGVVIGKEGTQNDHFVGAPDLPPHARMLVVLGGDGTLLYASRLIRSNNVPVLAINLGHLGFLSTGSLQQAQQLLQDALRGHLLVEERGRVVCQVKKKESKETIHEYHALNEVVFHQPGQARLFELEADLDGQWVTTYKADGLIVSTPTGSTAYNLAAGGPILVPALQALVMTPICPHALTARPLVVPLSSQVRIRMGKHATQCMLTIDGNAHVLLEYEHEVHITCALQPLHLYRTPAYSFFDVLRTKLHWGSRGDVS